MKKKKILALVLSAMLTVGSLQMFGCSLIAEEGEEVDTSRTQIYVAIEDDGIGSEYYDFIKSEYEKYNPNAQVLFQNRDATFSYKERALSMLTDDVACMQVSDYTLYGSYIMDVTAEMKSKSYDENYNYVGIGKGSVSAMDRIDADTEKLLNSGTADNPIYKGMPFYQTLFGIWYDVDLFNGNEAEGKEKLYGHDCLKGLDGIDGNDDDAWGPDGEAGTYDDGLPATWEDFKTLLLYMKDNNISTKPFVWSATEDWMQEYVLDQIVASYEQDDYALHYTFNGTHSKLGEITPQTAWKLTQVTSEGGVKDMPYRQGTKAAITVSSFIAQNELYSDASTKDTQTHLAAQTDFLSSITQNEKRSAFLFDGSWWQYEARETFNDLKAYGTRNFAMMPFPKFIGTEGIIDQDKEDKNIIPVSYFAQFVPLKNAEEAGKGDLIKDFIMFCGSNHIAKKLVEINSMMPVIDFKYSNDDLNSWTYCAKSQVEFRNDKNRKYTHMRDFSRLSTAPGLRSQYSQFSDYNYKSEIGGLTYVNPFEDMAKSNKAFTDKVWWAGMCAKSEAIYSQSAWPIK